MPSTSSSTQQQSLYLIDDMWFLFLDQDPALCEATLGYSSTHFGRRNRYNDQLPAAKYKMEAIRMINERLPDVKRATSLGTLIAVAVLANVEVSSLFVARSTGGRD
jgi:hypothetical protein